MIDKSLSIFLIILFGVSGIAILALTWIWPMPTSERILATFIGSVGIFVAFVRAMLLKSLRSGAGIGQGVAKVEVKDEL